MNPIKRRVWKWHWVPDEDDWLLIPSIKWSYWVVSGHDAYRWSLGIQWGKWYAGFGMEVYPV